LPLHPDEGRGLQIDWNGKSARWINGGTMRPLIFSARV
jgi:hypothetical protein